MAREAKRGLGEAKTQMSVAARVSSPERHGETSMLSIQESYLSPMSRRSHLGIGLSHNVDRPPEPVQGLSAPTPQRLDGEWNQAPTR